MVGSAAAHNRALEVPLLAYRSLWVAGVLGLTACTSAARDSVTDSGLGLEGGLGGETQAGEPTSGGGSAATAGQDSDESSASETDGPGGEAGGPRLDLGDDQEGGGVGGEGGECPCENVLDGIYVLDSNGTGSVWFYDPQANEFSLVGALGCDAPLGAVPNSMAIDRSGNAWLNYYVTDPLFGGSEGWLYRAALDDLNACETLDYHAQDQWYQMGMGYAVAGAASNCDTLYLYNNDAYSQFALPTDSSELARWDENSSMRISIGPTEFSVSELTGTGDGRLFGFATTGQGSSALVEFDKTDGSTINSMPLVGFDVTQAFAFAFWGGDVYFFTQVTTGEPNSKVTRLDYDGNDGGGLTVVHDDTGHHVTGAGVSTCASYLPPG